jgi:hypothetical protein
MSYTTITQTTAVSTSPGGSDVVAVNWLAGRPTSVSLSWGASNVLAVSRIQYSLDDPQRAASSAMVWNSVPAAISSNPLFYSASANFDSGATAQFLSPIAALRLYSTAITAGSGQSVSMRVLQPEGG